MLVVTKNASYLRSATTIVQDFRHQSASPLGSSAPLRKRRISESSSLDLFGPPKQRTVNEFPFEILNELLRFIPENVNAACRTESVSAAKCEGRWTLRLVCRKWLLTVQQICSALQLCIDYKCIKGSTICDASAFVALTAYQQCILSTEVEGIKGLNQLCDFPSIKYPGLSSIKLSITFQHSHYKRYLAKLKGVLSELQDCIGPRTYPDEIPVLLRIEIPTSNDHYEMPSFADCYQSLVSMREPPHASETSNFAPFSVTKLQIANPAFCCPFVLWRGLETILTFASGCLKTLDVYFEVLLQALCSREKLPGLFGVSSLTLRGRPHTYFRNLERALRSLPKLFPNLEALDFVDFGLLEASGTSFEPLLEFAKLQSVSFMGEFEYLNRRNRKFAILHNSVSSLKLCLPCVLKEKDSFRRDCVGLMQLGKQLSRLELYDNYNLKSCLELLTKCLSDQKLASLKHLKVSSLTGHFFNFVDTVKEFLGTLGRQAPALASLSLDGGVDDGPQLLALKDFLFYLPRSLEHLEISGLNYASRVWQSQSNMQVLIVQYLSAVAKGPVTLKTFTCVDALILQRYEWSSEMRRQFWREIKQHVAAASNSSDCSWPFVVQRIVLNLTRNQYQFVIRRKDSNVSQVVFLGVRFI